jgi:exonuclease SbcC
MITKIDGVSTGGPRLILPRVEHSARPTDERQSSEETSMDRQAETTTSGTADNEPSEDDVLNQNDTRPDDDLLSEARDALADARDVLLAEREQAARGREAAADGRDRAAAAREEALTIREREERALRLDLEAQAARLGDLIDAADVRDRAAEIRDRAAEARDAAAALRAELDREQHRLAARDYAQSDIDRLWAAADRDSAAADREEIRQMAVTPSPPLAP